ncbi:MAG: hypothetical protein E7392_06145 [Ruminococcaceae bacterium]|nr:hypothetical protein [Oscillospiraceae bacterium]
MLLIISIICIVVAIMKFYGFNIIHRIKKINIERSENRKKYDIIISLGCGLIGTVLLIFSSGWFYELESDLLLDASYVTFFIAIVLLVYAPIAYREGIIGKFLLKQKNNRGRITIGCYVIGVISALLLITLGIIFCSEYGHELHVYFLGMDTSVVFFILIALIVVSVFLSLVIKNHNKRMIIFISTLVMIGILFFSFFLCAFTTGGDYYTFSSPNKKHSIVIEEWMFLMGEGINVYERENMFFIRSLGTLPGEPRNGSYPIEWRENIAVITLNKGTENEETCKFILKNKK